MTRLSRIIKFGLIAAFLSLGPFGPADSFAQGHAVPRPPGHVVAAPHYHYYAPYYYAPYYYPWYYPGFYAPFSFGFSFGYGGYPYYGAPYYYGGYPAYYGPWAYDTTGAARLQVTPRTAQVYADGYFVGVVDNFDGNLQRLNLEAGQHELQFYQDGYHTVTQKVLFVRGKTMKITAAMQPLAPGESSGPPPKPDPSATNTRRGYRSDQGPRNEQMPRNESPRNDQDLRVAPPRGEQGTFGSLLLRVRPSDAEVMVDGEKWAPPQGDDQFVIELAEGSHSIEVRKNGFQTYSTTVHVRRGQSVRLNVSLTTGGDRSEEF